MTTGVTWTSTSSPFTLQLTDLILVCSIQSQYTYYWNSWRQLGLYISEAGMFPPRRAATAATVPRTGWYLYTRPELTAFVAPNLRSITSPFVPTGRWTCVSAWIVRPGAVSVLETCLFVDHYGTMWTRPYRTGKSERLFVCLYFTVPFTL